MAQHSDTPLVKKLGIREGDRVYLKKAPVNYFQLISPIPTGVVFLKRLSGEFDMMHVFITSQKELSDRLRTYISYLKKHGMIWVSWPKRASKVPTDVTENRIRELALPLGVVDIKVCAIDTTWSGLKLVIRKTHRQ